VSLACSTLDSKVRQVLKTARNEPPRKNHAVHHCAAHHNMVRLSCSCEPPSVYAHDSPQRPVPHCRFLTQFQHGPCCSDPRPRPVIRDHELRPWFSSISHQFRRWELVGCSTEVQTEQFFFVPSSPHDSPIQTTRDTEKNDEHRCFSYCRWESASVRRTEIPPAE